MPSNCSCGCQILWYAWTTSRALYISYLHWLSSKLIDTIWHVPIAVLHTTQGVQMNYSDPPNPTTISSQLVTLHINCIKTGGLETWKHQIGKFHFDIIFRIKPMSVRHLHMPCDRSNRTSFSATLKVTQHLIFWSIKTNRPLWLYDISSGEIQNMT